MKNLQSLEEGYVDGYEPEFDPLNPDIPATGEEEGMYAAAVDSFMNYLYSEEGTAKVSQALQQDKRPLHQVVPDILEPILLKTKADIEKAGGEPVPASVYVAEDGMFQTGVEALFDLASQLSIPGAEDKEEFAASLIGMFKKFGEHVLNNKDTDSIREGVTLGAELLATGEGGEVMDLDQMQADMLKKDPLARQVQSELSGEQNGI